MVKITSRPSNGTQYANVFHGSGGGREGCGGGPPGVSAEQKSLNIPEIKLNWSLRLYMQCEISFLLVGSGGVRKHAVRPIWRVQLRQPPSCVPGASAG